MIIQRNQKDGPLVARCPWDPNVIGQHRLTISGADWDDMYKTEVPMSFGGHKSTWLQDCSERGSEPVLWTQSASGGCWAFGVIVRNRSGNGPAARAIGLAHLAYKRREEAWTLGRLFQELVNPQAEDVYLAAMLLADFGSEQELSMIATEAFREFELGLGAMLASHKKILGLTTTENAAVSGHGHFGELSYADVRTLKLDSLKQEDLPGIQSYLKTRTCSTFV